MVEAALRVEAEYQLFCQRSPLCRRGIYVAPSETEPARVWDGIIFVAAGAFQGGVFGFKVHIPAEYPTAWPTLSFITPAERPRGGRVTHPEIFDDQLSLVGPGGATVSQTEHKIIALLQYLRDCLDDFNPADPRQQQAAEKCAERATAAEIVMQLPTDFAVDVSPYSSDIHGETQMQITS